MDGREVKIMVVDDEEDFRKLMIFWLNSKGYMVLAARDGKEAIELFKKESPDIIFLDLNMPVMDGATTLEHLRKINKDVPVIIISAYVDDQPKIKKAVDAGISGIFYKGKGFEEGLSLLESALRTHKRLKK